MDNDEPEIRILCVDDEPKVLQGLELTLGMDFDVTTANGGEEALNIIEEEDEPFALTISDMRMPGMDGAAYLSRVSEVAPDTVRVLLTGFSDTEAAIRAINHGRIFRFLSKPCEGDALISTVRDAYRQHRLLTSEKELLQQTLCGCIRVVTELLSMANPVAYNHGYHMTQLLEGVAKHVNLREVWEIELAIMLVHLGYAGMTPSVLQRAYRGKPLSHEELELVNGAAGLAHSLMKGIPRIEVVLGMVNEAGSEAKPPHITMDDSDPSRVAWGGHTVYALDRASQLFFRLGSAGKVAEALKAEREVHPRLIKAIGATHFPAALGPPKPKPEGKPVKEVTKTAYELKEGMVLLKDAISPTGVLFVKAGQPMTLTVLKLLRRMSDRDNLVEPVSVAEGT